MSICEVRPDNEWRRFLIGISRNSDKFFIFPFGKSHSPYEFESLKSDVEDIISPLCIGLEAAYPEKVINSFFKYSADCKLSGLSQNGNFSFASVNGASDMTCNVHETNMKNMYELFEHIIIYIYISYLVYVDVHLMLCGKALQKGLSAAGGKFWVSRHFGSWLGLAPPKITHV